MGGIRAAIAPLGGALRKIRPILFHSVHAVAGRPDFPCHPRSTPESVSVPGKTPNVLGRDGGPEPDAAILTPPTGGDSTVTVQS